MSRIEDQLTAQFHAWEKRGRGWQVFPEPVWPEPPFRPFFGHYMPEAPLVDDGRRPTILSSLAEKLSRSLGVPPEAPPVIPEPEEEPEPQTLSRDAWVELQTSLPANLNIPKEAFEQFLLNLSLCHEPVSFELLGLPGRVFAQFTACPDDAPLLRRQLQAHFPEAVFQERGGVLENAWQACDGDDAMVVEFGLDSEFMLPLLSGKLDPFVGIFAALTELKPGELGLFQVLFQITQRPWGESILRSVTDDEGDPFFVNMPELVAAAKNKISRPLFAAVVRLALRSERQERTLQIARDVAGSLRVFAHPNGNELIPLSNENYPFDEHIEDVLRRQSRRSGMLLNSDELIGFVHLPSATVKSLVFQRETGRTRAAPAIVRQSQGVALGDNLHAGESASVRLTPDQRVRHMHIIGASGTGKSTLIFNLIRQDIEQNEGVAVLDPHGDLVDRILGIIPENRIGDVVLVDPSDEEYSVGFNILSAHSDLEKNLLASDLVSVFQRLSTSWGDQMASVLNNAILAFLESDRGGTLADLRRFLLEPPFREKFLQTVRDPDVIYYWRKGFAQLAGNKSIGPVLTRLETFLSRKPIRYMVSQKVNRLDFANILDTGKIFLAKLSQGIIGRENSYLLGTLLVSKFQQLAMSRQQQAQSLRKDFWLYIDEFSYFITPSMAEILTGARKYRLGLVLAHQELRQLQRDSEVASAVMSNPFTRIVFRVGDDDARKLAEGFAHFEARDLQNLETGTAICRVERSDFDFKLTVPLPQEPPETEAAKRRQEVITASRKKCATPRAEVEADLYKEAEVEEPKPKPEPAKPKAERAAEEPRVEKPPPPFPPPQPKAPAMRPAAPSDLGRGGAQHQAIQKRIKEAAEALCFRSVIEQQILDGQGSVDLLLERSDQTIACEISITTTIDHEVGNVAKCLKAGIPTVAVICVDGDRLRKIAAAVSGSLGAEVAARVTYSEPDQFIAQLKPLVQAPSEAEKLPQKRRGYTVRRSVSKLTPEEQKQREEAGIRSIAEAMRRKGK